MTHKQYSEIMRLIGNIEGAAMCVEGNEGSFIVDTAAAISDILEEVMNNDGK